MKRAMAILMVAVAATTLGGCDDIEIEFDDWDDHDHGWFYDDYDCCWDCCGGFWFFPW